MDTNAPTQAALSADLPRSRRLERLIERLIVERLQGVRIDDDQILAQHADLLPELADRLRVVRLVEVARGEAASDAVTTAETPSASSATPAFPGYEIIREISAGGQGVVFEAIQHETRRHVAIKLIHHAGDDVGRRRFEREVELVAQLHHPNIVTIFHTGQATAGASYFVMDYVRGRTLRAHVRELGTPLDEALRLMVKVCDAVQHAHHRGVIHRDLKPSNIMVDERAEPRVLDFGLARSLADQRTLTLTDQVLGTLPYMSPEQALGRNADIDARTDVYSLGVVLYELLTGGYPYPVSGSLLEVLRHISETPPAPPTTQWTIQRGIGAAPKAVLRRGACPIDSELQTIVLRALDKDRARRYQSAGDLGRDLTRYLSGEPIEARRDSLLYVLRKRVMLYRRSLVAAGAVLTLTVALLLVVGFFADEWRDKLHKLEKQSSQIAGDTAFTVSLAHDASSFLFGWFLREFESGRLATASDLVDRLNGPERAIAESMLASRMPESIESAEPAQRPMLAFVLAERALAARRIDEARHLLREGIASEPTDWWRRMLTSRLATLDGAKP